MSLGYVSHLGASFVHHQRISCDFELFPVRPQAKALCEKRLLHELKVLLGRSWRNLCDYVVML